jgi:hypothetical protein
VMQWRILVAFVVVAPSASSFSWAAHAQEVVLRIQGAPASRAELKLDLGSVRGESCAVWRDGSRLELRSKHCALAAAAVASLNYASSVVPQTDSPVYEVHVGNRSFAATLAAPKQCELLKSGGRSCRERVLSPEQKLLLALLHLKSL